MGLVTDLQKDAMNENVSVTNLLRKATVVAKKLDVGKLSRWMKNEREGYSDGKSVPRYRVRKCTLKAFDGQAWKPVFFDNVLKNAGMERHYEAYPVRNSVADLEALYNESKRDLMIFLSGEEHRIFFSLMNFQTQLAIFFGRTNLLSILNSVRDTILEWALDLEKQGILGDDMSFTNEDRQKANNMNINYFENVENIQVQQGTVNSTQSIVVNNESTQNIRDVLERLKDNLGEIEGLEDREKEILNDDITKAERELDREDCKPSIVASCLESIKTVLLGAAGNVAANGYIQELQPLISSLLGG